MDAVPMSTPKKLSESFCENEERSFEAISDNPPRENAISPYSIRA